MHSIIKTTIQAGRHAAAAKRLFAKRPLLVTASSSSSSSSRPFWYTLEQQQRAFSTNSPPAAVQDPDETTTTHFGFESVQVEEKEGRVRQVFESVADSYDVMNDLMSGGLHRYWKDTLLDMSAVPSMAQAVRHLQQQQPSNNDNDSNHQHQLNILDVAGGTGDVAFRFVEAAKLPEQARSTFTTTTTTTATTTTEEKKNNPITVTVCDINKEMLRVGEARARERYGNQLLDGIGGGGGSKNSDRITTETLPPLSFVQGNAQDLHNFSDNSFDLYTIAFGLRNVTDVDKGLEEAFRVLKPGGRFMCLEFSQVPDPILRQIYDTYSFHVIPAMGEWVANDRPSYQYLVESIRKFSNQEELLGRMDAVGFQLTKYTNLTGGIVAIHEGWKPL